jgi:UPF0271 protein
MFITDASFIILNWNHLSRLQNIFIVPKVYHEIKNRLSKSVLDILIGKNVKIVRPKNASIESAKISASETGDIVRCSATDIEIIALAIEFKEKHLNFSVLTDDYSIQNVLTKLGIPFMNINSDGIKYLYIWRKKCIGCKQVYQEFKKNYCDVCGSKLKTCLVKKIRKSYDES